MNIPRMMMKMKQRKAMKNYVEDDLDLLLFKK